MGMIGSGFKALGQGLTGNLGGSLDTSANMFGLGSSQGDFYSPEQDYAKDYLDQKTRVRQDAGNQQDISDLTSGQLSLADFLSKNRNNPNSAMIGDIASTDPMAASMVAGQLVQQNPLLSGLYGKGGTLDRTTQEEKDLTAGGFGMDNVDMQKYGQESGNIARMFGSQENDIANSLASRGLAGAASGAAIQNYSGLMGNKNEQLAGLQRQVAQDAYNRKMGNLQNTRQFLTSLGAGAQGALNSQIETQFKGSANTARDIENQAKAYADHEALRQGSFQSKQDNYSPSLGEMFKGGIKNSGYQVGAAPGKFVSSFAGGMGGGMGGKG